MNDVVVEDLELFIARHVARSLFTSIPVIVLVVHQLSQ